MVEEFVVYGTKVLSDIRFPFDFPVGKARYTVRMVSGDPLKIEEAATRGFPFFRAHGREVYLYTDRPFNGSEPGQPWCYEVRGVARFRWLGGSRTIYYERGDGGTESQVGFWTVHLLLPLYFTLENLYDLFHAGAVEIKGNPVLFIAPSMGGKSTLTDYFLKRGHSLVADDKVPTFFEGETFMVTGAHPNHRPYRKFEELGYRVKKFMDGFKPIHAIYALERVDEDGEVAIKEIKGFKKFDTLLPNYLYTFSFLRPKRLRYLTEMINRIRVFQVTVPWDLGRIGEIHDAICSHSGKVT